MDAKNYLQVKLEGNVLIYGLLSVYTFVVWQTTAAFDLKQAKEKMSYAMALLSLLKSRTRWGSKFLRAPSSRILYHDTELSSWLTLSARPDGSD